MKTKQFCKTAFLAALPIGCVAGLGMTAQAQDNSVGIVLGAASVDGNDAAFQRRLGQDADFYGGISNLHYEAGSDVLWTVDGHAVFGNSDYGVSVGGVKEGTGYLKFGYNEFRTFYDLTGGYVPGVAPFNIDDEDYVDRGSVWFEAGLRREDLPEVTFRYSHDWRDGTKDSTIWGQMGAPSLKTAPSITIIDEESDTFTLDIAETFGNTDLDLGLVYRLVENTDTRVMGSGVNPLNPTAGNTVTDTAEYDQDYFNAHISSVSRLSDEFILSFGYALTAMDTDIGGQRPSVDNTTGLWETGADHALWAIGGGANAKVHVLNANAWWNPLEDVVLIGSLRGEFWDQNMSGYHIVGERNKNLADGMGGVANAMMGIWPIGAEAGFLEEAFDSTGNRWEEYTEGLEVRYDGIENVLLYAKGEWTQSDGEYERYSVTDSHNGSPLGVHFRQTDADLNVQKYTVGANWYALPCLSFASQAYYKSYEQEYTHNVLNDGALMSEHNMDTVDFNLRMTWRPLHNLTLVSRYDYQQSEIENKPWDVAFGLPTVEAADIETHIFSQSVTWVPVEDWYVQGMAAYVSSETDTPASDVGGLVFDFDNDYITTSLMVGYRVDDKTNVNVGYSLYFSENYYQPAGSVGYGSDSEEHVISVNLSRALTSSAVLNLGYAYYNSNDGTFGGQNSFDAHMVSTGLQVRF